MPKIQNIQADQSITKEDKLLGSDSGGDTRNYVISDISKFFKNTNAAGIAGQFTYQYKTASPYGNGTMRVTFSSGSTFQNITSLKVSKFIYGETDSSENLLDIFAASKVLVVDIEDQDNFGVYNTTTVTQDSDEVDFYNIVVSPEKFNGSLTNEKFYAIISIGGGSDKNFNSGTINTSDSRWSTSGDEYILTITHNLNKFGSSTVIDSAGSIVNGNIVYSDANSIQIKFTSQFACKVFVN